MPDTKTRAKNPTLPETFRLKITYRKVADLKPYAGNARTHSDKQIGQIAASIRQFGFTKTSSTCHFHLENARSC